jgi:hypothetical protein
MADQSTTPEAVSPPGQPRTGREIVKRFLQRIFVGLILTVAVAYTCDYAVLRFRIATNRQPYGTITVHTYYAVPQKNRKTEFLLGDPQDETCVHSLFPHLGDAPCWYLSRNREKRINM